MTSPRPEVVNGRWIDAPAPRKQHLAVGAMYHGSSTVTDALCGQQMLLVYEGNLLLSPEITPERACKTCLRVRDQ